MSNTIHRAIVRNGVAVPLHPIQVPDGTEVTINVAAEAGDQSEVDQNQKEIFEILGRRYSSGETDTAARHNEHQP